MSGGFVRCVICGGEEAHTDAVRFNGMPGEEGMLIEAGPAHELCAGAPPALQRWLALAEALESKELRGPVPEEALADWLRSGGQLEEISALALLDELCLVRKVSPRVSELELALRDAHARIDELTAAMATPAPVVEPTERDEELHGALINASVGNLWGHNPDLAREWELIRNASLLEIAQATERVRAVAESVVTTKSGERETRRRLTLEDRLAAACYAAACYDVDTSPVVVAIDQKQTRNARALMMVNCQFDYEGD